MRPRRPGREHRLDPRPLPASRSAAIRRSRKWASRRCSRRRRTRRAGTVPTSSGATRWSTLGDSCTSTATRRARRLRPVLARRRPGRGRRGRGSGRHQLVRPGRWTSAASPCSSCWSCWHHRPDPGVHPGLRAAPAARFRRRGRGPRRRRRPARRRAARRLENREQLFALDVEERLFRTAACARRCRSTAASSSPSRPPARAAEREHRADPLLPRRQLHRRPHRSHPRGRSAEVTVDWLTGGVTVAHAHDERVARCRLHAARGAGRAGDLRADLRGAGADLPDRPAPVDDRQGDEHGDRCSRSQLARVGVELPLAAGESAGESATAELAHPDRARGHAEPPTEERGASCPTWSR